MIPEISDRIVEIDRAMRWGYGHKLGPFELWDAIGFLEVVSRLERERRALPSNIKDALARGIIALYRPPEPRGRPTTGVFRFPFEQLPAHRTPAWHPHVARPQANPRRGI